MGQTGRKKHTASSQEQEQEKPAAQLFGSNSTSVSACSTQARRNMPQRSRQQFTTHCCETSSNVQNRVMKPHTRKPLDNRSLVVQSNSSKKLLLRNSRRTPHLVQHRQCVRPTARWYRRRTIYITQGRFTLAMKMIQRARQRARQRV